MNPRIGAARPLHHGGRAIDLRNGRREHALNRFVIELNLPAVKFSAVVFEGELVARHQAGFVSGAMGNPRRNVAASITPLPSRCSERNFMAPLPHANVSASSVT